MKTVEIIGYKRANLGKTSSKALRDSGNVPCVLYGGNHQVQFYTPMILFRPILYTPDAVFVKLNLEGDIYTGIVQDAQFHPVSEMILHVDFLELSENKPIKMDIPLKITGTSPGVIKGGKLIVKLERVKVKALPNKMPDSIEVNISSLEMGKSIRIKDLATNEFEIINNPQVTVASVEIPRALRGKTE